MRVGSICGHVINFGNKKIGINHLRYPKHLDFLCFGIILAEMLSQLKVDDKDFRELSRRLINLEELDYNYIRRTLDFNFEGKELENSLIRTYYDFQIDLGKNKGLYTIENFKNMLNFNGNDSDCWKILEETSQTKVKKIK